MSSKTAIKRDTPRNRRTSVRISDITRTVDTVKKPRVNPTENITSHGLIAGAQGEAEAQRAKVTFVNGDDWDGLFINGNLVDEGHSFSTDRILELLSEIGKFDYESLEANQYALEEFGDYPATLYQTRSKGIIE